MKKLLAVAAILVGSGVASLPANAQNYVVNGRNASSAEVQLLVSYGVQPGHWSVDGFGISPAKDEHAMPQSATADGGRKCRYVLDVLLCD